MEKESKSFILNLLNGKRLTSSDDDVNEAAKITFQIIFYGLFAAMLVLFWYVFKKQGVKR